MFSNCCSICLVNFWLCWCLYLWYFSWYILLCICDIRKNSSSEDLIVFIVLFVLICLLLFPGSHHNDILSVFFLLLELRKWFGSWHKLFRNSNRLNWLTHRLFIEDKVIKSGKWSHWLLSSHNHCFSLQILFIENKIKN